MLGNVLSRVVAIAVLLIFSGNMVLPALLADSESTLPACCRRDGKHRCAMMEAFDKQQESAGLSWKSVSRKCPQFPKSTVGFLTHPATPQRQIFFAGSTANHPVQKTQTEVLYRISHNRARQKRGPPSLA